MNTERNFVKIDNKLFYNYLGVSLIQESNNYYLVDIMSYLYKYKSIYDDEVLIDIESLVSKCGYKPDKHKGKVNDKFKEGLEFLRQKGYIISDVNFVEDKYKCVYIKVNLNVDKEFTTIYQDQIDKIKSYTGKVDKAKLLFLLGYIASRESTIKDAEDISHNLIEKSANGEIGTQVFWDSLKNISSHIELSETTIINYVNILKDLELVQTTNLDSTKQGNIVKNGVTIYTTLVGEIGKQHLKVKKTQLNTKSNGEKIIINNDNKSLNGKISREKQLLMNGKGDVNKYNELVRERFTVEIEEYENIIDNRNNTIDEEIDLLEMDEYIESTGKYPNKYMKDRDTYEDYINYLNGFMPKSTKPVEEEYTEEQMKRDTDTSKEKMEAFFASVM